VCGDGIVDANEACDDGNAMPLDGCEPDCQETRAVANIAGTGRHTCAVAFNGTVHCWGTNPAGEVGLVGLDAVGDDDTPAEVGPVSVGEPALAVATGDHHTCALLEGDRLRCWGRLDAGQAGLPSSSTFGTNEEPAYAPTLILPGPVARLTAGGENTCILLTDGRAYCFGRNEWGETGQSAPRLGCTATFDGGCAIGDDETVAELTPLNLGEPIRSLHPGYGYTCAVLESGDVKCFGSNITPEPGQSLFQCFDALWGTPDCFVHDWCCRGADGDLAAIEPVDLGAPVRSLDVYRTGPWPDSRDRMCAVTDAGTVCRELDDEATLETLELPFEPVLLSLAYEHACGVDEAGSVYCWGYGFQGQLGSGMGQLVEPADAVNVAVGGLVDAMAMGDDYTCVRTTAGGVRCWGANFFGQLGYGHTNDIGDNERPIEVGDVPIFPEEAP
jgi:cysteine-rich repeat protein